ncbi:MAG TPA: DUF2269 family protein [Acidimicrobiia bacterium]
MIAAFGSDAYKLVLVLHILCAIVGFGAVFLNGIYGQQAKARRGPEGLAISQANFLVSEIGTYFIYAVFLLGIVLVLIGDNVFDFGQTWIWLSMLLFLAALVASHAVLRPTVRRMQALMEEMIASGPPQGGPPPQAAEMEQLGKRLAIVGPALDLTMVVILVLMVFKPGGPSL